MKNETTGFRAASGKNGITNGKRSKNGQFRATQQHHAMLTNQQRRERKVRWKKKITPEYETLPKQAEQEKPQSEQIEAGGTPNRHKQ